MRCEVLWDETVSARGKRMLKGLIDKAPIEVSVTERYKGKSEILMLYGMGHPNRRDAWIAHVRNGGRMVGWDLGYWDREIDDAKMRVTIDADHPQRWRYREMPPERFAASKIELREDFDPNGSIVIVGLGYKQCRVLKSSPLEWERAKLAEIREAYPGKPVIFRPKRPHDPALPGCWNAGKSELVNVLRGTSLVVCRHSNVGLDACIAGIPVVCEDGAAAAIYGSDLRHPKAPSLEARRRLLEWVAWWQWAPTEASAAWGFLLERLADRNE